MNNTTMTEREEYTLWRRRNKVTLKQVSDYIRTSIDMLSKWELNKRNFKSNQQELYDQFIKEWEEKA